MIIYVYKNSVLAAIALAGVLASGSASAEFIQSDVYVAGDNKAVLDTDTGLEWMKLSETADTRISWYADLDNGWRLATQSEVTQYIYNLFDVDESDFTGGKVEGRHDITVYTDNVDKDILDIMGVTFDARTLIYAQGYVQDEDTGEFAKYGIQYSNNASTSFPTYLYVGEAAPTVTIGQKSIFASPFLVSSGGASYSSINDEEFKTAQAAAVPLPLMGLGALGLFALGFARKKKTA